VLADSGRPDDVVASGGQLLQGLEHLLRFQQVAVRAVAKRELLAPRCDLLQPGFRAGLDSLLGEVLRELREHRL